MRAAQDGARRPAANAVLGMWTVFTVATVATVTAGVWLQRSPQSLLLALTGAQRRGEDRLFGRIEGMNQRLRSENQRLHKLLQADESEDIRLETKLQGDDARKSAELRREKQREEDARAELDAVLGKGARRGDEEVASGRSTAFADESRRVREQAEVQSLLDAAKAQADRRLGLSEDGHSAQNVLAGNVDEVRHSRAGLHADGEVLRGARGVRPRESARRRRRKLRRLERAKYGDDMRASEIDLRHEHPHRARRELRRALVDHEDEERLRGFVGRAVDKKPEAWKLLRKTIGDDLADDRSAERVEDNMRAVVQLHRDVESAQHQYEDSKRLASRVPQKGKLAFMLNVPTRDGGYRAASVITHKMEDDLNRQERTWDRADALESAKAAAARELHEAEDGPHAPDHAEEPNAWSQRGGLQAGPAPAAAKPLTRVHFLPRGADPFTQPNAALRRQQLAAAGSRGRGSYGGAYSAQRGPARMQQPRACEDCVAGFARGRHCQACPVTEHAPRQEPAAAEPSVSPHAVLRRLKVSHAPSSALNGQVDLVFMCVPDTCVPAVPTLTRMTAVNGQDLGIKAKWRGVKAVNKARHWVGAAKELPKEPREVSNDIVERLLKLAHAGVLTAPEDVKRTQHPISEALASHAADNTILNKQEASYLSAKPPKTQRAHATLADPAAFRASKVVAQLETPQMRRQIVRRVETRALARTDARHQQGELAVEQLARKKEATAIKDEVSKEEHRAAAAARKAKARQERATQQATQAAAAAAAAAAAERAKRTADAPKGVWGDIAAPMHYLFGDSTVSKASPYLPA